MTKKQRALLYAYFYNRRETIERDIEQLQTNIRFRRVDQLDCLELIIAKEKLNTFNEVYKDIDFILKLNKLENIES